MAALPHDSAKVGDDATQGMLQLSVNNVAAGIEERSVNIQAAQHALTQKLNQRPQKQELIDRNILISIPTSPVIQSQARKLQWEKTSNQLEQKIRGRPELQEIMQRNILKGDPKIHPSITATGEQLMKKRIADNLNKKISERPTPQQLVKGGILKNDVLLPDQMVPNSKSSPGIHHDPSDLTLLLRRQSVQEPVKTVNSKHRHSVSGPVSQNSFRSPPPISMLRDESSSMEWEVNFDNKKTDGEDAGTARKTSVSSFGSLPSPLDFTSLHPESPENTAVPSPQATASQSSQLFTSSMLSVASTCLGHKGGGVASPRQTRRKSSSKQKVKKYNFHEYKPPAHQGSKIIKTPASTTKMTGPHSLLLQQQQILLQIQLLQQQRPDQSNINLPNIPQNCSPEQQMGILLKALSELQAQNGQKGGKSARNIPASTKAPLSVANGSIVTSPTKTISASPVINGSGHINPETLIPTENGKQLRVEDIKVNHLRNACKERGLGVTGKKTHLLERLLENNNGVLPISLVTEVMRDLNNKQASMPTGFMSSSGQYNSSISSTKQSQKAESPAAKSYLKPEQLQETINTILSQKKLDYQINRKHGPLAPAPVVDKIIDVSNVPHPSANTPPTLRSQSTSGDVPSYKSGVSNFRKSISMPGSPEGHHKAAPQQEDILASVITPSPLGFSEQHVSAAKADLLSPTTGNDSTATISNENSQMQQLSPTREFLAQITEWQSQSGNTVSSSNNLPFLHPDDLGDLDSINIPQSLPSTLANYQATTAGLMDMLADPPLLTSTASQPLHDILASAAKQELYPGGCSGRKMTVNDIMDTTTLMANPNGMDGFGLLDLDVPSGGGVPFNHGVSNSLPMVHGGKLASRGAYMPYGSPMLSNQGKVGSDLYLSTSHEQYHQQQQQHLLAFGRSPGSDQLDWLDLDTNFGSQAIQNQSQQCFSDFQFGEHGGGIFDGVNSTVSQGPQFATFDMQNDLGFGPLMNPDDPDIIPTSSEPSFVELGISH